MWLVRTLSRLSGREKAALYYPDPVCDQSAECVIYMMDVLRVIGAFVLTAFSNSSNTSHVCQIHWHAVTSAGCYSVIV